MRAFEGLFDRPESPPIAYSEKGILFFPFHASTFSVLSYGTILKNLMPIGFYRLDYCPTYYILRAWVGTYCFCIDLHPDFPFDLLLAINYLAFHKPFDNSIT